MWHSVCGPFPNAVSFRKVSPIEGGKCWARAVPAKKSALSLTAAIRPCGTYAATLASKKFGRPRARSVFLTPWHVGELDAWGRHVSS